jgi:hypothetical protein
LAFKISGRRLEWQHLLLQQQPPLLQPLLLLPLLPLLPPLINQRSCACGERTAAHSFWHGSQPGNLEGRLERLSTFLEHLAPQELPQCSKEFYHEYFDMHTQLDMEEVWIHHG